MLPRIGMMLLEEVRPRHIRELVLKLRADGKLAPRTIHQVFHTTKALFHYAVADELLDVNPCVLPKGVLPKKVDKNPALRATAIYTREEVEQLISDTRITEDRRVLYALKALAGLRHSEAAGLTWRQYDTELEPLDARLHNEQEPRYGDLLEQPLHLRTEGQDGGRGDAPGPAHRS